jgi:hypothetical protein
MNRTDAVRQSSTQWTLATIFIVAVGCNYVWELAQSSLYVGMDDFRRVLWHCFVASLGDGLLVLLIFGAGWAVLRWRDWFVRPGVRGYALMLAAGLVIAVTVEWVAVRIAGSWVYSARMPVVPLLGVGIMPVAQMLLLPPLIFHIVARRAAWRDRTVNKRGGNHSPEL